jgi:hypothetical protein
MQIGKTSAILGILGVLLGIAAGIGYWRKSSSTQSMDCVQNASCRPSYSNTLVCERLSVGTTENELIFRLGQPIERKGNTLFFEAGATEAGPIQVKLDDRRNAIQFVCRPNA